VNARRRLGETSHGLLVRRPVLASSTPRPSRLVDVVGQLEELATLLRRGLLSRSEFERQKRKVLDD
jgi:hypothetical protein